MQTRVSKQRRNFIECVNQPNGLIVYDDLTRTMYYQGRAGHA